MTHITKAVFKTTLVFALAATFAVCMAACIGGGGGVGKTLNSAEALKEYLDKQPVNGPDKPIKVSMTINDPMLKNVAEVIKNSGKYVGLTITGSALTEIPNGAFKDCKTLVGLTIPDSVGGVIHGGMFPGTSLTSMPLPKSADASGSAGGIIFYYSKAGFTMTDNNQVCHFLEAAPADTEFKARWGEYGKNVSTGSVFGSGRLNTQLIVASLGRTGNAAAMCAGLNVNGKTDWFLPSRDELDLMYNLGKMGLGGFSGDWYWSSSQYSEYHAKSLRFSDGSQGGLGDMGKNHSYNVRAVRGF